jgi:hypothetical protein
MDLEAMHRERGEVRQATMGVFMTTVPFLTQGLRRR